MWLDFVIFLGVLNACANVAMLEKITKSFKVIWNHMSLWGIVWWKCMQNVGAWRMLGCVQLDAISRCGHLDCHDSRTCEMGSRVKVIATFLTTSRRSVAKYHYVCEDVDCMCQYYCPWRGQVCSCANCWKWMGFICLCGE